MTMLNRMTSLVRGLVTSKSTALAPIALMRNSKSKEKHPVSMANLTSKRK